MTTLPRDTFTVLLIGSAQTGKTTFLERCVSGKFKGKYVPTTENQMRTLIYDSKHGPITFNVWDCVGDNHQGLNPDGVLLFFPLSPKASRQLDDFEAQFEPNVVSVSIVCIMDYEPEDYVTCDFEVSNATGFGLTTDKGMDPWTFFAREFTGNNNLNLRSRVLPNPELIPDVPTQIPRTEYRYGSIEPLEPPIISWIRVPGKHAIRVTIHLFPEHVMNLISTFSANSYIPCANIPCGPPKISWEQVPGSHSLRIATEVFPESVLDV